MAELKLPADIDIFGDHIRAPVADVRQRLATKGGDYAGDGKDPAIDPLRTFDQPDDRRELADLNAADQRGSGADPRVAGDRADVGILNQRRHQVGGGIAVEQGVAVDADQQVAAGGGGARFRALPLFPDFRPDGSPAASATLAPAAASTLAVLSEEPSLMAITSMIGDNAAPARRSMVSRAFFSSLKQGIRIEISGLPGSVGGGVSLPHGQWRSS